MTLRIALLAAFIQNDEPLAEKYFRNTLELQEDYPEAHFYYGIFLLSQEREEEAQEHWEKVLQQAEEDSPWRQRCSVTYKFMMKGTIPNKGLCLVFA